MCVGVLDGDGSWVLASSSTALVVVILMDGISDWLLSLSDFCHVVNITLL